MSRQTQAIIHADAIVNNFKTLQALAPQSQSMAVIKADAYGHGAVNVARLLRDLSPRFAVAIMEEAMALRDAGVTVPLVVLEGPHQMRECALAHANQCILVVHHRQQLEWLMATPPARRPHIWLKVDSGMHRLGFAVEEVPDLLHEFAALMTGETVLATHLACADDTANPFTRQQLHAFAQLTRQTDLPVSIANSPATLVWPQSHANWNRLGVVVFGSAPEAVSDTVTLAAAMTLRSTVMAVRTVEAGEWVGYGQGWQAARRSRIATVGIGYADGYPRHCPNGTPVAVNGRLAPLAGRVSMDMITVDVTELPSVTPGDRVELWGEQVSIDTVAHHAGTIAYELMTRVSARVPRIVRHR
ncbi:alanine racemase [Alteromonas sp. ASW11-19]|uniref:Alanine racemase n=1 Tax=Alteromonas salexigens TaxID=2982530 RepID=A0ABT2VJE7_9ALTE|nr:alanine racemase [Alteromonas salexigens]MCU7553219.1 alanine racemase [Alteromonas salexigens]